MENRSGQKLQRNPNLQKWAGLGEETPGSQTCAFRTGFAFYLMTLLREEAALLWKQWEWEQPSNLWHQAIKSHGASPNSGPRRSLPTFRQLHGGENIWGGRSDCRTWKKVMSEISKITRASPAWNYRCIDLYFLTSSDDLKTDKSVLTMSKGKKTSKLKNTSTKSYIRKMILFPHFSA